MSKEMTSLLDPGMFRAALGAFTTGVTIVTTRAKDGRAVGVTANSFNSVSLDPPMVLWSLSKRAYSLTAFTEGEHWAVHVLAADQEALSRRFASPGEDKFAGIDYADSSEGVPLLPCCVARFHCKTTFQYEGGDHVILVGEVTAFDHSDRAPLVFHAGRYVRVEQGASGGQGHVSVLAQRNLLRSSC